MPELKELGVGAVLNLKHLLVRLLIKSYENESEKWFYWQKVLIFFMTPKFARNVKQLL